MESARRDDDDDWNGRAAEEDEDGSASSFSVAACCEFLRIPKSVAMNDFVTLTRDSGSVGSKRGAGGDGRKFEGTVLSPPSFLESTVASPSLTPLAVSTSTSSDTDWGRFSRPSSVWILLLCAPELLLVALTGTKEGIVAAAWQPMEPLLVTLPLVATSIVTKENFISTLTILLLKHGV